MIDRLFDFSFEDKLRYGDYSEFGRVVFAENRIDFQRSLVVETVSAFHDFNKDRDFLFRNETLQRMHEGRLFKLPSGVPEYEAQIGLAGELGGGEIVAVHAHGDLSSKQAEILVRGETGNRDITLEPEDGKWEESKFRMAGEIAKSITKEVIRSEISGYQSVSREKMVVSAYHFGHTQCGAELQNFENVLQKFILNSNETLRDRRYEAQKVWHFIDLRGDLIIGTHWVETDSGVRLMLRSFTESELKDYLEERSLTVGYETQCIDDNFPFVTALESGLAEKAYKFNRKINPGLAAKERTREDSYVHNVGIVFVGSQSDSRYASYLQNGTQVLKQMSPRVGGRETLANASGALIYLLKPEWSEKYIQSIPAVYELVGPGHFSSRMKNESGVRLEANPMYGSRYPCLRGMAVGVGKDLSQATLLRTSGDQFKDIPRGPALVLSESIVSSLGGWERTLGLLHEDSYFFSSIFCVDPEADFGDCILHEYDNTGEDMRPVSQFGWKNLSG